MTKSSAKNVKHHASMALQTVEGLDLRLRQAKSKLARTDEDERKVIDATLVDVAHAADKLERVISTATAILEAPVDE